MADKSTQLILDALTRAAADPGGLPLYAQKAEPGLFPATSIAKAAAEKAKAEGLIEIRTSEAKGRAARDVCVLTDKGVQFLTRQSSPKRVIEDFVRILEERQSTVAELSESVARMATGLETIHAAVAAVLPRLTDHPAINGTAMNGTLTRQRPIATAASDTLIADVKARLAEWHATSGTAHDCPLPELFRKLEAANTASVGVYHDALRQLHDDHQIYLHPWTGPLYALPEPAFALMVGHEVAYYASIR